MVLRKGEMMFGIPRKIVDAIIKDLCDRRGLRQEFEQIDADTQEEIRRTWEDIVAKILEIG